MDNNKQLLSASSQHSSSTRPKPRIKFASPTPSSRHSFANIPEAKFLDAIEIQNDPTIDFTFNEDEIRDKNSRPVFKLPSFSEAAKQKRRESIESKLRSFRRPVQTKTSIDEFSDLPYTVVERNNIPLPVFLPRVSEIIPGESSSSNQNVKEPTPILVLDAKPQTEKIILAKDSEDNDDETNQRHNLIAESPRFTRNDIGTVLVEPKDVKTNTKTESIVDSNTRIAYIDGEPVLVEANNDPLPKEIFNSEDFSNQPSQTRLSRRIGVPFEEIPTHVASSRQENVLSLNIPSPNTVTKTKNTFKNEAKDGFWTVTRPNSNEDVFIEEDLGPHNIVIGAGSETKRTYYEENTAGSVHIGDVASVAQYAPLKKEISDAFIELKRLIRL